MLAFSSTHFSCNLRVPFASQQSFTGAPLLMQSPKAAIRKMSIKTQAIAAPKLERPDATGRFGKFGGKYVPETLIQALQELEVAHAEAMKDPEFLVRLSW